MELPQKVQWKILMEMADYAKRESRFESTIHLYKVIVTLQPYAYQGWLEYAKMEEEAGEIDKCILLLEMGLKFLPFNENLILKLIRSLEKQGN